MPQRCRHLLAAALAAAVAASAATPAGAADQEGLRAQIHKLQEGLEEARDQQSALYNELRGADRNIGRLADSLAETTDQLGERRSRLDALEAERSARRGELGEQRKQLANQLRAAYILGRQERLKLLLNQEEPAALGRLLTYYDYFNRARAERIGEIDAGLASLDELEGRIRDESGRLAELERQQRDQKEKLEAQQQQRRQVIARLDAEIRDKDQRLKRLQGDEKRLGGLVGSLGPALAKVAPEPPPAQPAENRPAPAEKREKIRSSVRPDPTKPFRANRGRLAWPAEGTLAARYGAARLGGVKWQGLVIDAPAGGLVRAVARGRVAYADWLRGYGMLMIVDHGGGFMSLYGYNRSLHRRVGEWVEAGDAIARVGASGGREEPGLYFELRQDGKPINPLGWLGKG